MAETSQIEAAHKGKEKTYKHNIRPRNAATNTPLHGEGLLVFGVVGKNLVAVDAPLALCLIVRHNCWCWKCRPQTA